jgi:hypothetical protein
VSSQLTAGAADWLWCGAAAEAAATNTSTPIQHTTGRVKQSTTPTKAGVIVIVVSRQMNNQHPLLFFCRPAITTGNSFERGSWGYMRIIDMRLFVGALFSRRPHRLLSLPRQPSPPPPSAPRRPTGPHRLHQNPARPLFFFFLDSLDKSPAIVLSRLTCCSFDCSCVFSRLLHDHSL